MERNEHVELMQARIKKHEGLRLKPYHDSLGKLTIGYGHNLEARGISKEIAEYLFQEDFVDASLTLARTLPEVGEHLHGKDGGTTRAGVLIEMVFQMGMAGVLGFRKMFRAIAQENWDEAADQMLDSKWHTQTPGRCQTLAQIMRTGKEE